MDTKLHHQCVQRAIELGRSSDPTVLPEYWGMEDNLDYQIGMLEKKKLYQQAGKKLVSLHASEKHRLRDALREKLSLHVRLPNHACRLSAPVDTPIPLSSDSETDAEGG